MASQVEFKFKYQNKKSELEVTYDSCKEKFFIALHWITVLLITTISFFTGVTQTDVKTFDMSLYCNVEKFNKSLSSVSVFWAVVTIFGITLATVVVMSVKMVIFNKMSKDIINIANYFIGLLFSWDVTYILQNMLSYPIPSFYTNDQLRWYYCCKDCPEHEYPKKLELVDMESRGSFPSFLMVALCYTTTFFYLFMCLLDTTKSFAAKLITFIAPGFVSVSYGFLLWINNQNHIEDILAGSFLGIFMAMYTIKDLVIKPNKNDRFSDDFISVLMVKEHERSLMDYNETGEDVSIAEYTINVCSHNIMEPREPRELREPQLMEPLALEDTPPPSYSSLD